MIPQAAAAHSSLQLGAQLISNPTPYDVILGRGSGPRQFKGSQRFLKLISTKKDAYARACNRDEKDAIARLIVDHVQQSLGGRFLKRLEGRRARVYYEVDYETALRKAKQALRERTTCCHLSDGEDTWEETAVPVPRPEASDPSFVPSSTLSATGASSLSPQQNMPLEHSNLVAFAAAMLPPELSAALLPPELSMLQAQSVLNPFQAFSAQGALSHLPTAGLLPGAYHPSVVSDHPVQQLRMLMGSLAQHAADSFQTFANQQWQSLASAAQAEQQAPSSTQPIPLDSKPPSRKHRLEETGAAVAASRKHRLKETDDGVHRKQRHVQDSEKATVKESDAGDFLINALKDDPDTPKFTKEEEEKERASLTPQEKQAALIDVFGKIGPSVKSEKTTSLECLLLAMRLEMARLPVEKRLALLVAQEKSSAREFSDERLELFLRREDMNVTAAAKRFALYWEKRRE